MTVFLTGCGAYLPGEPLDNDEVARRLGDPLPGLRKRIMAANGIRTRHLALDENGTVTMLNEELAAEAVVAALKDRGLAIGEVGMLAAGTTQGDLLVPGFASMVHGRLDDAGPMEVLSSGGVCASSMAAFTAAARAIEAGDHDTAVIVGSELVSRSLRAREGSRNADTEFLRWTLSDGAAAVVLQNAPRPQGLSLRLDWTHLVSYAHERPVCMSAGGSPTAGDTWLDPVTPDVRLVQLRQEVAMLPDLFRTGVHEFAKLIREGKVSPSKVDHLLCHYSAERFRGDIVGLLKAANLMIDEDRWFTNLHTRGNTGAASIFVMLEEAWHAERFREGDRILLVVPESGRFSFAFAHLTCVTATQTGPEPAAVVVAEHKATAPAAHGQDGASTQRLVLDLAQVWEDFERRLRRAPIVRRIESGTASVEDYRRLLVHLRQQVVEGGRWISRAASNFSVELFDFRSAAIKHAADEHKDYRLLERDFVAVGGELSEIQHSHKNAGSEALSAFIFQQASLPDPVDLLGAMFIIEGLGNRLALGWARRLQEQLALRDDQVSFLRYHGEADEEHIGELNHLLTLVTAQHHERVVRTAQVVARLYALQLEEVN
ncbi:hypothetical protein Rhe02_75540 [Rhizocola hellebori]|uniref:3-oxoacyl-ACP synthase n=1 Tax=Rhizocola hellebori TaxID=1392758 RepID=A0A8J3QH22_9ACTN|nr:3-oxoacyl-[acyl-carrier-protein] synthase III C-terminal domain-containing protein [Rhizocola hellebori]GIH09487.1 hypothetical protein Rhe02_75540 [Rhizocola hellebori]